jgi:hypothetical protein
VIQVLKFGFDLNGSVSNQVAEFGVYDFEF